MNFRLVKPLPHSRFNHLSPRFLSLLVLGICLCLSACGQTNASSRPKSAAAKDLPIIGIQTGSPIFSGMLVSLKARLADLGFVENENVVYHVGVTLDSLATNIPLDEVDIFITIPANTGEINFVHELRARIGTETPIVFATGTFDPVAEGLAESLSHPNQNVTGVILIDSDERRFDLFHQLIPTAQDILLVYNPDDEAALRQLPHIQALADTRNLKLSLIEDSGTDREKSLRLAADLPDKLDGIFLLRVFLSSEIWAEAGIRHQLPVAQDIGVQYLSYRPIMLYGPLEETQGEQIARLVAQILNGQEAGNLPIENADVFLTLDNSIAAAIDLDIPSALLEQARDVRQDSMEHLNLREENQAGACLAAVESAAGPSLMCFSVACDGVPEMPWINTNSHEPVAACDTSEMLGICHTLSFDIVFYSGGYDAVSIGCTLGGGEWNDPASSD